MNISHINLIHSLRMIHYGARSCKLGLLQKLDQLLTNFSKETIQLTNVGKKNLSELSRILNSKKKF